jgi:small conductance mechanosensitive channel
VLFVYLEENRQGTANMDKLFEALSALSVKSITAFLLHLVGVIVLFIIGIFLAKAVRNLIVKTTSKVNVENTISAFVSRLVYWGIIVVFGIACLSIFGVETASIAAVLGAGGLAIGLAFQGCLSNFASGFMLVIFRPFKIGDRIVVDGTIGKVIDINFFETIINTGDMRRIIIPNSKIYGTTIQNITANPMRRVDVQVGVSYAADIEETRTVLEDACLIEGRLENEKNAVIMKSLDDYAVKWECRVWCNPDDYYTIQERLVVSIKKKLDAAGIEIPFPQLVVHANPNVRA